MRTVRRRFRPELEQLEDRFCPSAYVVTNLADSGPGSLRSAVQQVNQDAGTPIADTITIAVSGTIELQSTLVVRHFCTIIGPGEDLLCLDGQGQVRVWNVYPPNAQDAFDESPFLTTISGMTVENGVASNAVGFGGGGLISRENICLEDMCFENCSTQRFGGAVIAQSALMVEQCMFEDCSSAASGGAIAFVATANPVSILVTQSYFADNSAANAGGAIAVLGSSDLALQLNQNYFDVGNTATTGNVLYLTPNSQVVNAQDCVFADYNNQPLTFQGDAWANTLPSNFPMNEICWD